MAAYSTAISNRRHRGIEGILGTEIGEELAAKRNGLLATVIIRHQALSRPVVQSRTFGVLI